MSSSRTLDAAPAVASEAASTAAIKSEPAHRLALGVTAAIETMLLILCARGGIAIGTFLVVHAAIVLGLAGLAARRATGGDATMLLLALPATAAIGPLGALGALALGHAAPAHQATTRLLAAWYERMAHSVETDAVSQLCDVVATGRAANLSAPPPMSFPDVMEHGSLAEKQALLGLIARSFELEYLRALERALVSPEPVIRVQAAAVAKRVQGDLERIAEQLTRQVETGRACDVVSALRAMAGLDACIASSLLEEVVRKRALSARNTLGRQLSEQVADPRIRLELLPIARDPLGRPVVAAYEAILLADGRFRALRNWRRVAGIVGRGRLRVRPRGSPGAAPAAGGLT